MDINSNGDCPVCHSTPNTPPICINSRLVNVCDSCTHLWDPFSNPKQGEGTGSLEVLKKTYLHKERDDELIRSFLRIGLIQPGAKVLDFGAGPGFLSDALRRVLNGQIVIDCVESSPIFRDYLLSKNYNLADELEADAYDLVILKEVIEHVDQPVESLEKILYALNPRTGYCYLTTPAGDWAGRCKAKSNRENWQTFKDPTHVHFFTEDSLLLSIKKAGFLSSQYIHIDEFYPPNIGKKGSELRTNQAYINYERGSYPHLTYLIGRNPNRKPLTTRPAPRWYQPLYSWSIFVYGRFRSLIKILIGR